MACVITRLANTFSRYVQHLADVLLCSITVHCAPVGTSFASFEITLIHFSETSDYLLGKVTNPLAVIRRTSENL